MQPRKQELDVGELNRRIQIQQQMTAQDAYGQPQQNWSTIYTCWAKIDVQRSQLLYETAEFIAKTAFRITIRWTKSIIIQPNMRIVYVEPSTNVTHTYNIEGLLNLDQANVWLTAICYELNGSE